MGDGGNERKEGKRKSIGGGVIVHDEWGVEMSLGEMGKEVHWIGLCCVCACGISYAIIYLVNIDLLRACVWGRLQWLMPFGTKHR